MVLAVGKASAKAGARARARAKVRWRREACLSVCLSKGRAGLTNPPMEQNNWTPTHVKGTTQAAVTAV